MLGDESRRVGTKLWQVWDSQHCTAKNDKPLPCTHNDLCSMELTEVLLHNDVNVGIHVAYG